MANNFLPFTPTDTGTNLLSQSDYLAAADRTIGNQPGVASAKLNNKAIRQATYVVSQLAQYIADKLAVDVLDDATPARLLAQMNSSFLPLSPTVTKYLSSSGNHDLTYYFRIATGSATAAATYTNNGVTYTVKTTVASGLQLIATGNGAPTTSGTLTKASGTGDTTLTFYAVRAPLYIKAQIVGGGGGGSGSANNGGGPGAGGNGGDTTFGTTLLTANGGKGGGTTSNSQATAGGTASLGSGPVGLAYSGGAGQGSTGVSATNESGSGGMGGVSFFGGGGGGGFASAGQAAATNSGSGGGGGSYGSTGSLGFSGAGGGAGGFVDALITSPLSTYAYSIGAAGTAGTAGTGGVAGGAGAAGMVIVTEHYQ